MRRSIVRFSIGFLLIVLIAEIGARVLMESSTPALRWYDDTAALKIDALDERAESDVVFAGTSMAWQAFVPQIHADATGDVGYNAGLAGGTPEVMDRWLTEEVASRSKPRTVVWGVSSFDLAPNYGEENAEAYDSAAETSQGVLNEIDRALSGVSTLIKERSVLRDPNEIWGEGREKRDADLATAEKYLGVDGERLDFREDTGRELRRVTQARLAGFSPDPQDVATIEETVAELQGDGVEVVFVELPVPPRFVELHPEGESDHAEVGATFSQIAERTGSRFLRLSEGYDDDDFVDFTHLDQPGIERFMGEFEEAYSSDRDDAGQVFADSSAVDVEATPEACETETILDEYGFEIEVCVEEPGDSEEAASLQGNGLATDDTQLMYARIVESVLRPCESPGWYEGLAAELDADEQATLAHLAELLAEIESRCDMPLGVTDLAELLTDLEQLSGDVGPLPTTAPDTSAEYSSRIAAALDALFVRYSTNESVGTRFWSSVDEYGALRELHERSSGGEGIDTVVIGSSQAAWAVDQSLMADAFDHRFLNLGQPGADAEEWQTLLGWMMEGQDFERVIWADSAARMVEGLDRGRCGVVEERVTVAGESRADLFVLTGWEGLSTYGILGEDAAISPYEGSDVEEELELRFHGPGDRIVPDANNGPVEIFAETREEYLQDGPGICAPRLEALEKNLSSLVDQGVEVILVELPVHPERRALGAALIAEADAALGDVAARVGIERIRLEELSTPETRDGFHTTRGGRVRVTKDLIAALEALGVTSTPSG
jgi:hypothetical protein